MEFCLHAFLCTTCVPGVHGDQRRTKEPLEMELQVVVNCWVSVGSGPLYS